MKKLLAIITIYFIALSPAYALSEKDRDFCATLSELARSSMGMRQVGVEIVDAMATANSDIGRHMIIDAYSRPAYYTEEVRERAEREFATEYYIYCIKSF